MTATYREPSPRRRRPINRSSNTARSTLRIRRYNPENGIIEPAWHDYPVAGAADRSRSRTPSTRSSGNRTAPSTYRRSCGHGICGSDAMRINGRNRLACKTLIKDLPMDKAITIEAIKGLPLEKDLVVDMEPFFEAYRDVKPFLITEGHEPTRERRQSQHDRERYDDTTKCILCAACTTSCPVFWSDNQYFGPAAIVGAHRFIFDSRDEGASAATRHPQRPRGRVAVPHDLQLHRGMSARHRDHPGHPRSQASTDLAQGLIGVVASACARLPRVAAGVCDRPSAC